VGIKKCSMKNDRLAPHDGTQIRLSVGISSLAAAALLIHDADIPSHNIIILEQLDRPVGSLHGAGSPKNEIFDWGEVIKTSSKSSLAGGGQKIDAPEFGLTEQHCLTLEREHAHD
jgi:oleate hydratase